MRILSWDIGIRNLAVCLLDNENILFWKTFDLIKKYPELFTNKKDLKDIDKLTDCVFNLLDEYPDWTNENINLVLIENQPALKNPIMKSIQCTIYSYFKIKKRLNNNIGPEPQNINAVHKLQQHDLPDIDILENFLSKYYPRFNKTSNSNNTNTNTNNKTNKDSEINSFLNLNLIPFNQDQVKEGSLNKDQVKEGSLNKDQVKEINKKGGKVGKVGKGGRGGKSGKGRKSRKESRNKYKNRKNMGIELAIYYLHHLGDENNLKLLLNETKAKKDDLADSYLQARYWMFKNLE